MDSLNSLANSLPPANLANAEKDLLNTFKAAAQSITTLYRASRHTSKRAYNAGYIAACEDLLRMIQQGVSDAGRADGSSNASGMDVGRVMDWVDARLDAIRAREEEEDEDEERERSRAPKPPVVPSPPTAAPAAPSPVIPTATEPRPAPSSTAPQPAPGPSPAAVPAPAPASPPSSPIASPPAAPRANPLALPRRALRPLAGPSTPAPALFSPPPPPALHESAPDTPDVSAGAKRRHAVMMMLDAAGAPAAVDVPSTPTGAPVLGRRRTRSTRALPLGAPALTREGEDMDVDEGGRERKRVARR